MRPLLQPLFGHLFSRAIDLASEMFFLHSWFFDEMRQAEDLEYYGIVRRVRNEDLTEDNYRRLISKLIETLSFIERNR
jgi:hypothetical protein